MKAIILHRAQSIASSLLSSATQDVESDAKAAVTSRALVPLPAPAGVRHALLRPLAQARRELPSPEFVETVVRPVASGFLQALLLHALQPSATQAPVSPQRPLRTWLRGQLARKTAPNQGEPASNAQAQLPASSLPPAGAAQWRYLHIEVHTWTTGASTDAMTVDIVAVQSVTHDFTRT